MEDGLVGAAVSEVLEEEVQEAEVRAAAGEKKQITKIHKKTPPSAGFVHTTIKVILQQFSALYR